jgi:hypothetical protein
MNVTSQKLATDYQQSLPAHLVRTRNADGDHCYFVIRCSKANIVKLLAKKGREQIDIAQYGEVLIRGYGETVSAHDVAVLKTRFNLELADIEEA